MSLTNGFLGGDTASAQFSEAFRQIAGDGVCARGGLLALTVSGFYATLSTGYAIAAGRFVESDEPVTLRIPSPWDQDDRTDAIAAVVEEKGRSVTLQLLEGVDQEDLPPDCVPLYFIRVRRGAGNLTMEAVTDVRPYVVPLSRLTPGALRAYQFLKSGIDLQVNAILAQAQQVSNKADAAIANLDAAIRQAGGMPEVGELMTARRQPVPVREWLPCAGGPVPEAYPALSALLDGTMPDIPGDRYKTYIYGGAPTGG